MTRDEKFQYWFDAAEYDMETAEAMYASGRWFYVGKELYVVQKTDILLYR